MWDIGWGGVYRNIIKIDMWDIGWGDVYLNNIKVLANGNNLVQGEIWCKFCGLPETCDTRFCVVQILFWNSQIPHKTRKWTQQIESIKITNLPSYKQTNQPDNVMEQNLCWQANSQLRNSPPFYEIHKFIAEFKTARYMSLSWTTIIQPTTSEPISLKSHFIITLPSMPVSSKRSLSFRYRNLTCTQFSYPQATYPLIWMRNRK